MIDLSFKEASVLTSVLKELGHPEGPFGDQHLLTTACTSISERTMVPLEEIFDALIIGIGKIQEFVEQERPNQIALARRNAN